MNSLFFKKIRARISAFCKNRKASLLICFIAGSLGALPYYCEALFVFTFVSLFLLFCTVIRQRDDNNGIFLPFFCYFAGFYGPLYLFLSELYPYERFGFSETQAVFVVTCSCVLIPLLHALTETLIMIISKIFPSSAYSIIGYAALWVIGEWVLTLGTLAFPWGNIAVSLTGFLPYLQTASLFGKSFITFITVAGCCAFAFAAKHKKRLFALYGAAIIILNTIVGMVIWFIPSQNNETVKIAAVQGNVLSNEKWALGNQETIYTRYISLLEDAAEDGAQIIILPESAIPQSFRQDGKLHKAFSEIAGEYNVTIIAGITCYEDGETYNSVIAVYPDGTVSERYDKRHLVPFGEFMPFVETLGEFLPFIQDFNESSADFAEGNKTVVINTEHGSVTPLVCFDSIFPQFASDGVDEGAEMIAVVTNDSWFNDSAGIYTHLRHAKLRAIENKRYVLRAANTGISAFIDEHGRLIEASEPLTVDTVYAEVLRIEEKTLYTVIGDVFVYISFFIIIFLIIKHIIARIKNGKNTTPQQRDL